MNVIIKLSDWSGPFCNEIKCEVTMYDSSLT